MHNMHVDAEEYRKLQEAALIAYPGESEIDRIKRRDVYEFEFYGREVTIRASAYSQVSKAILPLLSSEELVRILRHGLIADADRMTKMRASVKAKNKEEAMRLGQEHFWPYVSTDAFFLIKERGDVQLLDALRDDESEVVRKGVAIYLKGKTA